MHLFYEFLNLLLVKDYNFLKNVHNVMNCNSTLCIDMNESFKKIRNWKIYNDEPKIKSIAKILVFLSSHCLDIIYCSRLF